MCALAGNRTQVNCLEGSYAHHYTTNAHHYITNAMMGNPILVSKSLRMCISHQQTIVNSQSETLEWFL